MISYLCFAAIFVVACNGQAQPDVLPSNPASSICTKRNSYLQQAGSCDSYIECRDFQATKHLCPDGLNYNPRAKWPEYPCGYPKDVPCLDRGATQPAKPTAECPHQYGVYPSLKTTPDRCGDYRMCVEGRAFQMSCPVGLAFNEVSEQCDWPDQVSSCNVDDFLGFKCPAPPLGADGQPLDIVQNFKYEGDCYYFFSCEKGRARLLSCDFGFAFDPVSTKCVDADLVQCQLPEAVPRNQPIDALF